jgi:hypothetical protein
MKTPNRQRLLVLVAAVAVGLLAFETVIVKPLVAFWKPRAARLEKLRKSVADGNDIIGRERSLLATWDTMRTNTLPKEISTAESTMLRAFARWARDGSVTLNSVRPQWKRLGPDAQTLECRVDVAGNLPNLTRFLYAVETDPLAVRVDTVQIMARDTGGQQLTLGLEVSGLWLEPTRR